MGASSTLTLFSFFPGILSNQQEFGCSGFFPTTKLSSKQHFDFVCFYQTYFRISRSLTVLFLLYFCQDFERNCRLAVMFFLFLYKDFGINGGLVFMFCFDFTEDAAM